MNPPAWTTDAALALAGDDAPGAIAAARAAIQAELVPVPRDGALRVEWSAALDERLRRLAVKVSPALSPEQANEWRTVMVEALSDLPAMVALTAAKRALHRPMTYMNEIEGVVREIAGQVIGRRWMALGRLDGLEKALALASDTPAEELEPIEPEKLRALNARMTRLGLATRFREDGSCFQVEGNEPVADATQASEALA